VPESTLHSQATRWVLLLLLAWAARAGRSAKVAPNLALRWRETQPKVGGDPDLALYEPPPTDFDALTSVCTWLPGHAPPKVALEVVSAGHPTKDYVEAPKKYAESGTGELWVFDPLLAGPRVGGGPYRLQIWAHDGQGRFVRIYAGEGPARSRHCGGRSLEHRSENAPPAEAGGSKLQLFREKTAGSRQQSPALAGAGLPRRTNEHGGSPAPEGRASSAVSSGDHCPWL
jgi:hypothetical protein